MVPRGRLDITWWQLGFAAAACAWPGRAATVERRIAAAWEAHDANVLPCLSVRSGLDLVLRVLALPRGGRVLMSAVTIPDVARILAHHGLVPVPVDLDMTTLGVTRPALECAYRPGTVAVLVAHLFGARMPMEDVLAFAREHGLLVLEDCAQAYDGRYRGHPDADVSFFSFGTIKTSTALGGAVLRFLELDLLSRVRAIRDADPAQPRMAYFRRICRHAAIKVATWPPVFTVLVRVCERAGRDLDDVLRAALRGFGGCDVERLIHRLRHRPSYPLLALLAHRLHGDDVTRVARRVTVAGELLQQLEGVVDRPGAAAPTHTHWVLPIDAYDPDALVAHLRRRGFDATRHGSSLCVVEPPADQLDAEARAARDGMARVVFLPFHPHMTPRAVQGLVRQVTAQAEAHDASTVGVVSSQA